MSIKCTLDPSSLEVLLTNVTTLRGVIEISVDNALSFINTIKDLKGLDEVAQIESYAQTAASIAAKNGLVYPAANVVAKEIEREIKSRVKFLTDTDGEEDIEESEEDLNSISSSPSVS